MKKSTKLLLLILVLGLLYSIGKFARGHGGGEAQNFLEGMYFTSFVLFLSSFTILIINIRHLKHYLNTLVIMILCLPTALTVMGGIIETIRYNRTPDLSAKYPRPVTPETFIRGSLRISEQIDSLVALKNRNTRLLIISSTRLDTVIYSQLGDQVFIIYAVQYKPNELGNDISPAYLSASERDSIYWHLREGPPNAEYMSGNFHDWSELKNEVRKFYFNQYLFALKDSAAKNYIWETN
jgi:hypothetical protein